jgi:hypothetical protein
MPQSHLYDLDENGVGVCRHLVPGFNHKICGTRLVPSKHGLIITFLACFGRPAQGHIEAKIHDNIIETGKLIGSKEFRNRELYISLYNQLKANLTASLSKMQNYLNHIQTELNKVLPKTDSDSFFSTLAQSNTIGNTVSDTVVNTVSQLNQTTNNTPIIDNDNKPSYSDQTDNEPDKFDIAKDIERAKKFGLFDDYGFSN